MDLELFRKLGSGAKFDFKRFQKDAEKLKIIKPQSHQIIDNVTVEENQSKNQVETPETLNIEAEVNIQLLDGLSSGKRLKKKKSLADLKTIHEEKVNDTRKANRIHVSGTDLSGPFENFNDLAIFSEIKCNIEKLGYMKPTPIQMQTIPIMLQRREILACAPTGSGKTAAFIIPILQCLQKPLRKGFRAVVLSPTRELAKQTFREFYRLSEGLKFRIHMINKIGNAIQKFGPNSSKKFDILVTTPNRLVFLLQQTPPVISLNSVEWLVIDESDKLFEAGTSSFRDQLATIYQVCDSVNIRRAMFSATYSPDVEDWCQLNLDNLAVVFIGDVNSATDTVKQELMFVGNEEGKLIAFRDFVRQGFSPPLLVFVKTKERAKQLFFELIYDGINVDVIHADRSQMQRDNVVKSFREGKIWVLITTELMGRGIDFKGVNVVINYDLPSSSISYIHRIGRTGRAGRPGTSITYFTEEDVENLRRIGQLMKQAGCPVPDYLLHFKAKMRSNIQRNNSKKQKLDTSVAKSLKENKPRTKFKTKFDNKKSLRMK